MFAFEHRVHDNAGNPLRQPGGNAFPVDFEGGYGGDGPLGEGQYLGHRGVVRRWPFRHKPATFAGQGSQIGGGSPAHQAALGNVAIRIALPHAQQGLSVVVHLDLPSTHRSSAKKRPRVAMNG